MRPEHWIASDHKVTLLGRDGLILGPDLLRSKTPGANSYKANMAKQFFMDRAIDDAAFILKYIDASGL